MHHKIESNDDTDWRIKGSSRLSERQLVFLKYLWLWREKQAQSADQPPFRIMHNEKLLNLVIQLEAVLEKDADLIFNKTVRFKGKRLQSLKKAAQKAFHTGLSEYPLKQIRHHSVKPSRIILKRIEHIRSHCQAIAEQHNIPPELLLSRALIGQIAKAGPDSLNHLVTEGFILPWQCDLIKGPITDIFQNTCDMESPNL